MKENKSDVSSKNYDDKTSEVNKPGSYFSSNTVKNQILVQIIPLLAALLLKARLRPPALELLLVLELW